MAIESKNLLVWVKAMSRGQALPLDASEIYASLEEAQNYAGKSPIAYGGQSVKVLLEDGKYHEYILQPSDSGYTLEEAGSVQPSDLKQYVVIDTALPESNQEQGVIYIDTTTNTGNIWNGVSWVKVFSDFQPVIDEIKKDIKKVETALDEKAPLANPTFTGTVTVGGNEVAVKSYVDGLFAQLGETVTVPAIVDSSHPLPSEGYKAGQMYRVAEAGAYAGQECEVGDLILVIADHSADSASEADFMIIQANIDGAVTSAADVTTVGEIVVFDSVTGKVVKGSSVQISSVSDAIAKAHEHANKEVLDSYDKTQAQVLEAAKAEAKKLVDESKGAVDTALEGKADKATTLEGYGIADAYTKVEIDGKFQTVNDNLNTKVTASEVDTKIQEAEPGTLAKAAEAAKTALEKRVGEIPDDTSIKQYVDTAVGAGGADVGEAIAAAKQEAIDTSKAYTDEQIKSVNAALTVTEF